MIPFTCDPAAHAPAGEIVDRVHEEVAAKFGMKKIPSVPAP